MEYMCLSLLPPDSTMNKIKAKSPHGKKVAEGTSMYVISAHVWKTEAVGRVITVWKDRKSGSHTSKCALRGLGETNGGADPRKQLRAGNCRHVRGLMRGLWERPRVSMLSSPLPA